MSCGWDLQSIAVITVPSLCISIYIIIIWKLYSLCHFTDQTTEVAISKFGSVVLNSIRMKTGIIQSVLILAFHKEKKETFLLHQVCILNICFLIYSRRILILSFSIRAILINAIIKTGKTLEIISNLHCRKAFSFI